MLWQPRDSAPRPAPTGSDISGFAAAVTAVAEVQIDVAAIPTHVALTAVVLQVGPHVVPTKNGAVR